MGCVERHGYPKCYGAIYRNSGCTCPPSPRGPLEGRMAALERKIEELSDRVIELEQAARGETHDTEPASPNAKTAHR